MLQVYCSSITPQKSLASHASAFQTFTVVLKHRAVLLGWLTGRCRRVRLSRAEGREFYVTCSAFADAASFGSTDFVAMPRLAVSSMAAVAALAAGAAFVAAPARAPVVPNKRGLRHLHCPRRGNVLQFAC